MIWLLSAVLLACSTLVLVPLAVRLMTDRASSGWPRLWPFVAGVGLLALVLPRGAIAMGLAGFLALTTATMASAALRAVLRSAGAGTAGFAAAQVGLTGGAVLLVLERAGWQQDRAGWVLLAAAVPAAGLALLAASSCWAQVGTPDRRAWLLVAQPVGAALVALSWAAGWSLPSVVGALLVLIPTLATTARAVRIGCGRPGGPRGAAGRRRAVLGMAAATVGVFGLVAAPLAATQSLFAQGQSGLFAQGQSGMVGLLPVAALALVGGGAGAALSGWHRLAASVAPLRTSGHPDPAVPGTDPADGPGCSAGSAAGTASPVDHPGSLNG